MKRSRKLTLFCTALALVTGINAVLCWRTLSAVHELENHLANRIENVQNRLNGQLGGISEDVRSTLEEQSSILASFSLEDAAFDRGTRMARFRLSAVPRQFIEGSRLTFHCRADGGALPPLEAAFVGGSRFEAELALPISAVQTELDASLTLPDGTVLNQQLEPIFDAYGAYRLHLNQPGYEGSTRYTGGMVQLDGQISFPMDDGAEEQTGNTLVTTALKVERNGEPLDTLPFEDTGDPLYHVYTCPLKKEYPARDGDRLTFAVELEDSNGVRYRAVALEYVIEGDIPEPLFDRADFVVLAE